MKKSLCIIFSVATVFLFAQTTEAATSPYVTVQTNVPLNQVSSDDVNGIIPFGSHSAIEGDISYLTDATSENEPTANVILGPENTWLGVTWDFGEPTEGFIWKLERFDIWIAGEDDLRKGFRGDISVSSDGVPEEFKIVPNSYHFEGLSQNNQYNYLRYDFPDQFIAGSAADMHRYPVKGFRYLRLNSRGDTINFVDWQTRFVETDIWVSLVPAPAVFTSVNRAENGDVTLTWNAFISRSYNLEYKTDLNQSAWTFLATITADESTETYVDETTSDGQRYYQLVSQP